jgi:hypothetical protein
MKVLNQENICIENKLDEIINIIKPSGNSSMTLKVDSTTSEVLFAPSELNRVSVTIHNNSTKILYIKLSSGVTPTSYTYKLRNGDYVIINEEKTDVYAVWSDVNGFATITITQ